MFEEKKSIVVMRWDRNIEYFYEVNGEEAEGYRSGVRQYHFDSFLGVYPN